MKKNEEIVLLADEILNDLTNSQIPLANIILKSSKLSLLVDAPSNVKLFQSWSKTVEHGLFLTNSYDSSIAAAQDRPTSIQSANPKQYIHQPYGNSIERNTIKQQTEKAVKDIANCRAQIYSFALNIYQKWKFGNIAESIFEKKRKKTEPKLRELFPDIDQRLNSIESNLNSTNPEDWKNAIVSCRTIIMQIADILEPATEKDDIKKYNNRIRKYISRNEKSNRKASLLKIYASELSKRVEITSNTTQGSAHKYTPTLAYAEDTVLMTYLLIADLLSFADIQKEKTLDKNKFAIGSSDVQTNKTK